MFWGPPFSPLQTDTQESGQLFTAQINELDQTKHSQGNKIQMQKHAPQTSWNPVSHCSPLQGTHYPTSEGPGFESCIHEARCVCFFCSSLCVRCTPFVVHGFLG